MESLVKSDRVFVRPSPTRESAGGVGAQALATIRLCEQAGFDPVIVETVGVGQAEVEVADLVDMLVVVLVPNLGDELQGIKRGLLEYADVVVVNKADGELREAAELAADLCRQALALFGWGASGGAPWVSTCSAREGTGMEPLWSEVRARFQRQRTDGILENRRAERRARLFDQALARAVLRRVLSSEGADRMRQEVARGELELDVAVARLVASLAGC
jgi:LAO/AO transport system kinase